MIDKSLWPQLEAENQAEMLAFFGTAAFARSHLSEDVSWVLTGVDSNDYNGVVSARLEPGQADSLVPALVQKFRSSGVPALWHLGTDAQPPDMAQRLERLGCRRLSPGVCMAAPLSGLKSAASTCRASVDRVASASDLAAWMEVWNAGSDGCSSAREQLYASLGLQGPRPLQHFVARLEGRAVGVAQLFLGSRAAGVYCVSVLPPFQRQGIGAALTLAALDAARHAGHEIAVLGPSPQGQPLYERLGFELFSGASNCYALPW